MEAERFAPPPSRVRWPSRSWPFISAGKVACRRVIGLVLATGPVAGLLLGPVVGGLADRWGRRPVITAAMVLRGLSLLGIPAARAPWQFALLNFGVGLAWSMFRPGANAAIADVVAPADRTFAYGVTRMADNIGFSLGPLVGAFAAGLGPQIPFVLAGVGSLLLAVALAAGLRETVRTAAPEAGIQADSAVETEGDARAWRRIVADRGFHAYLLGGALTAFAADAMAVGVLFHAAGLVGFAWFVAPAALIAFAYRLAGAL